MLHIIRLEPQNYDQFRSKGDNEMNNALAQGNFQS